MAAAGIHSLSPTQLRLRRFRRMKRGYYSFLFLAVTYVLSFFLPLLMSNRPIVVKYEGEYYFPVFKTYWYETLGLGREDIYLGEKFGQTKQGEADYRALRDEFRKAGGENWLILPLVPYHHSADQFNEPLEWTTVDADGQTVQHKDANPPYPPSAKHWMGRDDRGRDVGVRLAYGYRVSITFALVVAFLSYTLGILAGAVLGFFGGYTDFIGQRFVEIWGAMPFLYTVIIMSSLVPPQLKWIGLVVILTLFAWMPISYYIRGEFYREKTRDYVAAAIATGESRLSVMLRHIFPNTLTPIITFLPFAIVGEISALVALDFLGLGLQPPAPSWGELLKQAREYQQEWHLVVFPLLAMFITLQLIVFVGEAVREAFDPKVYSRLR